MNDVLVADLAALGDDEWRTLTSAMHFVFRNAGQTHPLIDTLFGTAPTPDEWEKIKLAARATRAEIALAATHGRTLSRREYMRLYMQRRRLMNGVQ